MWNFLAPTRSLDLPLRGCLLWGICDIFQIMNNYSRFSQSFTKTETATTATFCRSTVSSHTNEAVLSKFTNDSWLCNGDFRIVMFYGHLNIKHCITSIHFPANTCTSINRPGDTALFYLHVHCPLPMIDTMLQKYPFADLVGMRAPPPHLELEWRASKDVSYQP